MLLTYFISFNLYFSKVDIKVSVLEKRKLRLSELKLLKVIQKCQDSNLSVEHDILPLKIKRRAVTTDKKIKVYVNCSETPSSTVLSRFYMSC